MKDPRLVQQVYKVSTASLQDYSTFNPAGLNLGQSGLCGAQRVYTGFIQLNSCSLVLPKEWQSKNASAIVTYYEKGFQLLGKLRTETETNNRTTFSPAFAVFQCH